MTVAGHIELLRVVTIFLRYFYRNDFHLFFGFNNLIIFNQLIIVWGSDDILLTLWDLLVYFSV